MDHKASRKAPYFAYLRLTEIQLQSESSLMQKLIFQSAHNSHTHLGATEIHVSHCGLKLWLSFKSELTIFEMQTPEARKKQKTQGAGILLS